MHISQLLLCDQAVRHTMLTITSGSSRPMDEKFELGREIIVHYVFQEGDV
jgi:hypothetical protein